MTLLAEIRANLDDPGPRLVYADELQSRGDPRGEFIAVQCELARLGYATRPGPADWEGDALIDPEAIDQTHVRKLRARENALLEEHGASWAADALRVCFFTRYRFERGFVAHVAIDGRRPFVTLLDAVPMLESLDFAMPPRDTPISGPPLEQIRALAMSAQGIRSLVAERPAQLRRLAVGEPKDLAAMRELIVWRSFAQLTHLELTGAGLDANLTRLLLANAGPLVELQLRQSRLGAAGASHVADCAKLEGLQILSVLSNAIGPTGTTALAESDHLRRLRALDLRKNGIGVAGATAIGSAFPELRTLDLTGNSLGEAGLAALVGGKGLGKLRELCLQQTRLDDAALAVLADSPLLGHVRILSLRSNHITDEGARTLARSRFANQLSQINLHNTDVGPAGKQALVAALDARVLA